MGRCGLSKTCGLDSVAFRIELSETGEVFSCGTDESVLHGLAKTGRRGIPVGCRGGGCGICKVEVVNGQYRRLPMSRSHISAEDEAQGKVLACRVVPESDLRIMVIGKLQKAVARTIEAYKKAPPGQA